jgi:uncharacterized protein (TIRG00374 family)
MVGIFLWKTDHETWHYMTRFRWIFLPIALIFVFLRWSLDGMAFVTLSKHGSKMTVKLRRATIIRLEGTLVGAVIPFVVGMVSMHAYLLHREKLRFHESMAITSLRAILPIFIFLINIPIFFLFETGLQNGTFFTEFIKVITGPLILIIVFFIITLFFPHKIKAVASTLIRWWGRIKFIHVERIMEAEERFFEGIDQYSHILLTYFKKRKRMMLAASGWILAAFIADYFTAIAIIWGFGGNPNIFEALAYQSLIRPLIYLAPTPGGVGVWDLTYLGFFSHASWNLPSSLIGVLVFCWRLLVTYVPCIFGGFFLTKEFQRDRKLREMMLEKGKLPEEEEENESNFDTNHI